ncbi:MAG: hypothetical protein L0H84_19480 [Pseudonocardia sp.]|nr:hypothetical protein [Pseudonocardia sp.]
MAEQRVDVVARKRGAQQFLGATPPAVLMDIAVLEAWARAQGWQVQADPGGGVIRFTAPDGRLITALSPVCPFDRLVDVLSALRRYGLVWPPTRRFRDRASA